jgi:hypothetical protein
VCWEWRRGVRLGTGALSLVGQLPEDAEDAAIVLAYMRDLVDNFLAPDRAPASSGAPRAVLGLRLMEPPIQFHAQAPPLAIVEPIEGQSGNESH